MIEEDENLPDAEKPITWSTTMGNTGTVSLGESELLKMLNKAFEEDRVKVHEIEEQKGE